MCSRSWATQEESMSPADRGPATGCVLTLFHAGDFKPFSHAREGVPALLEERLQGLPKIPLGVLALRDPALRIDRRPIGLGILQQQTAPNAEILALLIEQIDCHLEDRPSLRGGLPPRLLARDILDQFLDDPRLSVQPID
jgi:hypothetical protein